MEDNLEKKKGGNYWWGFLMGAFCCAVVVLLVTLIPKYTSSAGDKKTSDYTLENDGDEILEKLQLLQTMIDDYFLYEVDEETLVNSLYSALLDSLGDPYSCYYTAEEFSALMESQSGIYCGIGVVVSQNAETGEITVVDVYEDCPGAEAGMLPEDIIRAVDGVSTADTDINTVVTWIKGKEHTTVDITVERDGKEITLTAERREISEITVESVMLDDQIGYIAVSGFEEVTESQFEEAVDALEAEGMKGLVIDLRGNPGGLLDVVVNMADYLLPEGLVVYTEDKYGERTEYASDPDAAIEDVPIVVLVDENSASASEVFTGAMQDYKRAVIVGTQTYGKGIVQSIIPLNDGSAIKITVSTYYTPNGNNIHGAGITPDVVVELDEDLANQITVSLDEDNQLQAAIEVLSGEIE